MSNQTTRNPVEAPARLNAAIGDEKGIGKSWMVKKTMKAGRGDGATNTNNPPAHHLTTSRAPTKQDHRAQQRAAVPVPPLHQITASRLGLEILNSSAMDKDRADVSMLDTAGTQPSKGARGEVAATQKQKQKEDWLRPDTDVSTAEQDRLAATQTRLLKRLFDAMREDAEEGDPNLEHPPLETLELHINREEGGPVNAKKQRVAGESGVQKPSLSVEEALAMGRAGSRSAYLKERLEYNLLERERLLRELRFR